MPPLEGKPAINRTCVHPSINANQISHLADEFYAAISLNAQLGQIFQTNIAKNSDTHLDKIKRFWRSVLLRTEEYKGQPLATHLKIDAIERADFQEWIKIFSATARKNFSPEAAVIVEQMAQRIATSLWLSRNPAPFAGPPIWSLHDHEPNPKSASI